MKAHNSEMSVHPVLSPEQVCRFCRHEVGSFLQSLAGMALRLQRTLPVGHPGCSILTGMEEKGRLLVQSIEQVMQENISMAKAPPLRIVVVEDDPDSQQYFCDVINEQHHDVVGRAGSGPEMVRVVLEKRPDMVIFDIRLPGFDGLTALREIMKQYVLPSVAITGDEGIEMMERATQDDIIGGYNIKPVNKSQLIAAIRVAWAKWKQFLSISDEAEEVKVKLANRKIIERAKDRIAKMYGWSGDTAMRAMQRVSSQNNWTLVETAEKINLGKNVIPVEAK